ncbi:DNA/RNA nuclease SfsA [Niallia taxi]|uniref:DNA/RNA nuclease SfsA n=1 Tax=Niallia taxi TaxID=2499688 RepID=UPI002E1F6330|nr:DNA/RNA nuclease SfsA [Niallia taxi]MED4054415.1 DNA/RNA nuclease SfsA [Niallia taxi]MED4120310.1 DNA/RNA nuclease SfsA [Niallia taxi]
MSSLSRDISEAFPQKLVKMVFKERPNRFILHCLYKGSIEVVHLADPGRLKELLQKDTAVYVLPSTNPNRKTKWTAVLVEYEGIFVSINTTYPNKLIERVLKNFALPELSSYEWKKSEFVYGHSRWDFMLEDEAGNGLLLEVKSVTLAHGRIGMFPDAVTARGAKHVQELAAIAKQGEWQTAILFVVQREDVDLVTAATHIDPFFAQCLEQAEKAGVRLMAYTCDMSLEGIQLSRSIPVQLDKKMLDIS